MYPELRKQFFEGSIHLVFAVVIAQGFTIAGEIFLPISNLYSYDGMISALALVFVYFFIVTSWYGFFKSVKLFPHNKIGSSTLARYGCAFFNTFILYYMITLTKTVTGVDYSTIFWLIAVYFAMIIVVHFIKASEMDDSIIRGKNNRLQKILVVSIVFFGIFFFQAMIYDYLTINVPYLKWDDKLAWNPIFIIISFFFVGWYRWVMWKEKWVISRRSKQK